MTREWKPGDVAMTIPHRLDGVNRRAIRIESGEWIDSAGACWSDDQVLARSLAAVDPEDREQVAALLNAWKRAEFSGALPEQPMTRMELRLRTALREFANPTPPKPDEPTAYLAAVVDAEGNRWHVSDGPIDGDQRWYSPDLNVRRAYRNITAVRVLSEGVEVDR